ncbi:MAG TPA: carboxyltransferase domain-containing protein [Actinomycetota bacterium]|nr:carboxyltransferase domain-containing protein [Actinomycetota bacterium]
MKVPEHRVEPMGDRGLLIRFAAEPSAELTAVLTGTAKAAARLEGVLDACPGLTTVLVETETGRLGELERAVAGLMADVEPVAGSLHEVDTVYDGEDLDWVCEHLGIDAGTLVARHSEPVYDVRLLGSPGFVYLSDVAPGIAVPRLDEPRRAVPAGSVGIGGTQTGIYSRPRPGGWRIIARVPELPQVVPGDRVRFVPR